MLSPNPRIGLKEAVLTPRFAVVLYRPLFTSSTRIVCLPEQLSLETC